MNIYALVALAMSFWIFGYFTALYVAEVSQWSDLAYIECRHTYMIEFWIVADIFHCSGGPKYRMPNVYPSRTAFLCLHKPHTIELPLAMSSPTASSPGSTLRCAFFLSSPRYYVQRSYNISKVSTYSVDGYY
ncbi:hypothetical protein F5B22DRAFT_602169 [Xylaria bambusicola]|uniref:uncharacterized protein n=1 Tax=Xylaria bambusicola TaxID=326684 RepID=UPI0020089DAF|nr:uncharacterized protein F5B22DRAFT_602169 [Xylaria bambusicola]KAI0517735.1 hypothetical protein F5B22DRAFT_602169 [Xylaria bambusicola]